MSGYIKLHRQLLESVHFQNPNYLKVWIWMLLKANFKTKTVSVKVSKGYTNVIVNRGQFIFGRHRAAIELDMDDSMVYRIVMVFQKSEAISIKSNNQYSVITICKYDDYNSKEENNEQPVNSGRTADEQPMSTTKKDKKDKKGEKEFIAPSLSDVVDYFFDNGYLKSVGERAFNFYNNADWLDSNEKQVKNWKLKMQQVWFKDENKIVEEKKSMVY